MKRAWLLCAAVVLLFAACTARADESASDGYELYYAARLDGSDGGDAIRTSRFQVEDGASLTTTALAEVLVRQLLAAPEDETLRSPFPGGTTLQKLTVGGGRAMVDLSEQYARLSGIDLSIADCCVTLTLTQLDGINAVHITADGRELPYRKTQLLTAADALLSKEEEMLRTINVSLYFLDVATGELRAQQQTLALYEGQSRANAVLDALLRGPENDETLQKLLPDDFAILSSRTEDNVYYVNIDGRTALPGDEALRALAVESLAESLLSLSGVDEVQFLIDGVAAPQLAAPAISPEEPAET